MKIVKGSCSSYLDRSLLVLALSPSIFLSFDLFLCMSVSLLSFVGFAFILTCLLAFRSALHTESMLEDLPHSFPIDGDADRVRGGFAWRGLIG